MSKAITAKQSKQARSLLKWNVQDVISKCTIAIARLEAFERGNIRLSKPENETLHQLYVDHGIEFGADFDVRLKKKSQTGTLQNRVVEMDDSELQAKDAEENLLTPSLTEERQQRAKQRPA